LMTPSSVRAQKYAIVATANRADNRQVVANCPTFENRRFRGDFAPIPCARLSPMPAAAAMSIRTCSCLAVAFALMSLCLGDRPSAATPEVRVKPGEFVVDHPTLINLGFEWAIDGDANRNAEVRVSYRKAGETQWKPGLSMLRLDGERIYQQGSWDVVSPNMFAGSILDLEPDTAYEARFVLSDPDGIVGQSAKTVT